MNYNSAADGESPRLSDAARAFEKRMACQQFCGEMAGKASRWGELDCAMAVADWIMAYRGTDPAGPYRGAYHSDDGARAIVKQAGGFLALISQLAEAAGLEPTDEPEYGDVGVIDITGDNRLLPHLDGAAAICIEKYWLVKAPRGVMAAQRFNCLKAWRV